ncbi:MAG TPA: hypothetical protein VGL47_44785 [Amycolatopsis sp.]|uniref:Transposase n=1 Tax=Amycolatopsis nalaikhensis TaxID=715472 RepID=A0ABY8XK11_9PSEU|nr:hypothetical protein [Amycolatopsis sp. 2-2]WIV55951.1 hypothetical protein QP939_45325 [Amycolatopsis sp. 2-2]
MTAESPLPPDPDAGTELAWLRKENALLRVERDMLMRVAAGYASDMALLRRREPERPS